MDVAYRPPILWYIIDVDIVGIYTRGLMDVFLSDKGGCEGVIGGVNELLYKNIWLLWFLYIKKLDCILLYKGKEGRHVHRKTISIHTRSIHAISGRCHWGL